MKNSNKLKQTSLCILFKKGVVENEILLAMKKRGFGEGRWNGAGGKIDKLKGDTCVYDCAIRETNEEILVLPKKLEKVAVMDFYFPHVPKEKDFDQQVHVYFVYEWEGEPKESEEMRPGWFKESRIPYGIMWPDDIYWLPMVLKGKKLRAEFHFDEVENVKYKKIEEADYLD